MQLELIDLLTEFCCDNVKCSKDFHNNVKSRFKKNLIRVDKKVQEKENQTVIIFYSTCILFALLIYVLKMERKYPYKISNVVCPIYIAQIV